MNEFDVALGQFLARQREAGGLSQEALATALGRDQPVISRIERGQRRVTVADLLAWLRALDIPLAAVASEVEALPSSTNRAQGLWS